VSSSSGARRPEQGASPTNSLDPLPVRAVTTTLSRRQREALPTASEQSLLVSSNDHQLQVKTSLSSLEAVASEAGDGSPVLGVAARAGFVEWTFLRRSDDRDGRRPRFHAGGGVLTTLVICPLQKEASFCGRIEISNGERIASAHVWTSFASRQLPSGKTYSPMNRETFPKLFIHSMEMKSMPKPR
jgi:hypothetical protein